MKSIFAKISMSLFILLISIPLISEENKGGIDSKNNSEDRLETSAKKKPLTDKTFPINFYSDYTTMDGISREIKNCGNAKISQGDIHLTADCLVAKKLESGDYQYFKATGKPAVVEVFDREKNEYLYLKAENIFYDVLAKEFIATNHADLILSNNKDQSLANNRLNIKSHNIVFTIISDQERVIDATGSPVNLDIRTDGDIELNAKALQLNYSTKTTELYLKGSVEAELALGKITAGEFSYNHRTKQSSFKKAKDQQIEIIQKPKL